MLLYNFLMSFVVVGRFQLQVSVLRLEMTQFGRLLYPMKALHHVLAARDKAMSTQSLLSPLAVTYIT